MYDIYYLHEYVQPFKIFEKTNPLLIYYEGKNTRLCYVVHKNDIADFKPLQNAIYKNKYFDIETPYGYGGPLVENYDKNDIKDFFKELNKWAVENKIVSQFFRFHPLLRNHKYFEEFCDTKTFKQTVCIDLQNEDIIYKNMNDKCRNMIKKARKSGIETVIDNSIESWCCFKELYKQTMERNNANEYYFFNKEFFEKLYSQLGSLCNLFCAKLQDKYISMALIYECNELMHYHLSASNKDYLKFGATNILLYEAAKYGAYKNYKSFHLGGGVGAYDGLFIFKKSFNKNNLIDFYIGRNIFNHEIYNLLMLKRKELNADFDLNTSRMIGYRA